MKRLNYITAIALSFAFAACQDNNTDIPKDTPEELPEWYYTGGELGTTHLNTFNALEQPTESIENKGMYDSFKRGEDLFE